MLYPGDSSNSPSGLNIYPNSGKFSINTYGDAGLVADLAGTGVTTSNNQALVVCGSGGELTVRYRTGDVLPGMPTGSAVTSFQVPSIDDAGRLAFTAFYVEGGISRSGLWVETSRGLKNVCRTGVGLKSPQGANDDELTGFSFYEGGHAGNEDIGNSSHASSAASGWDANSQTLVFRGNHASGKSAIWSAAADSLVPPPNLALKNAENVPMDTITGKIEAGETKIYSFSEKLVYLSNTGDASLDSLAFTIEGPDAAFYQLNAPDAASLPAGVEQAVSIRFQPITIGTKYATLRINSNDPKGARYVSLVGTAIFNGPPTDLTLSAINLAENNAPGAAVGSLTASDPDAGDTHTFSLVSGTGSGDNSSFIFTGNSLNINVATDFEIKGSYALRFRATDAGGVFIEKAITVAITNLNESPTDLALSASALAENNASGVVVGTITAADPDAADTHTFTLVSGTGSTDNASFAVTDNLLRISVVADREAKSSYALRLRATDAGGLICEKALTVTINNVNEAPTNLALSASSLAENNSANATVGTLSATDPDLGNTHTIVLVSGPGSTDNGSFTVTSKTLKLNVATDFETKSSYALRLRATDGGGLFFEKAITVSITNVNEVPTGITLSATTLAENSAANATVGTLSASDPDLGDTHAFSLVPGTGSTDNAAFSITAATLKINSAPVMATQSSYAIRIRTTDSGGLFFEKPFTITITAGEIVFIDWAANAGLIGADALPTATPFNDGVENLLKYAFNMNAAGPDVSVLTTGGTAGLPQIALDTSGAQPVLKVAFLRRKGSGLIYTPQRSDTLGSFVPMTETQTVTSIDAQWERVTVQEPAPPATAPSAFVRVQVSLP
jgi:hypothetical protein